MRYLQGKAAAVWPYEGFFAPIKYSSQEKVTCIDSIKNEAALTRAALL